MTVVDSLDAEIQQCERALAALKRQRADARDREFLLTLRRVIPPAVPFLCAEVIAHAALHAELAAAVGPMETRQLGLYFARLARRWPDAFERVCRDEHGCYWQLSLPS